MKKILLLLRLALASPKSLELPIEDFCEQSFEENFQIPFNEQKEGESQKSRESPYFYSFEEMWITLVLINKVLWISRY